MTSIHEIQDGTRHEAALDWEVEFRFYRREADTVWVVGDFTNWQRGRMAMARQPDGWWSLTMPLPPGEYRFRYLAHEHNAVTKTEGTHSAEAWYTDFASHGVEYAKGEWNSVIVVPVGAAPGTDPALTHKQQQQGAMEAEPQREMLAA